MKKRKYVYQQMDRYGKPRWYFRKAGCKVRLPGEPGSEEFERAYWATMDSTVPLEPKQRPQPIERRQIGRGPRIRVQPKQGFVYFLRAGNAIKIGFTQNAFNRTEQLKTGLAYEMTAFVAVKGTDVDERRMHRLFAAYHSHGEWFVAGHLVRQAMARAAAYGTLSAAEDAAEIDPTGPGVRGPQNAYDEITTA